MLIIDEIAYRSPLARITPKRKILFGVIGLSLCLVLNSFAVSIFLVFALAIEAVCISKVPVATYLRLLAIPLGFLLIGTLTIMVGRYDLGANLLWGVDIWQHSYGISSASLRQGLGLILKSMGAISCMYFITLNTPMNHILATLRAWHVPSLLVTLMELIYRYIFLILDEAHKMKIAQASRLGYVSFKTAFRTFGELMGTLFLRTYLKGDRIYAALESRGYEGEFYSLEPEFQPSKKLAAATVAFTLLLLGLGIAERSLL